jgi:hypothetical protein
MPAAWLFPPRAAVSREAAGAPRQASAALASPSTIRGLAGSRAAERKRARAAGELPPSAPRYANVRQW